MLLPCRLASALVLLLPPYVKRLLGLRGALLGAFLAGLLLSGWLGTHVLAADAPPAATLMYLDGGVQGRVGGSSWRPLCEDAHLTQGDELKTSRGSLAVLLLWDRSTVKLAESSHLVIKELAESPQGPVRRFVLHSGKIWVDAEKHSGSKGVFEIHTSYGQAAVKGTAFEVEVGDEEAAVHVWEGEVEYAHQEAREVLRPAERLRHHRQRGLAKEPFDTASPSGWQRFNLQARGIRGLLGAGGGRLGLQRLDAAQRRRLRSFVRGHWERHGRPEMLRKPAQRRAAPLPPPSRRPQRRRWRAR